MKSGRTSATAGISELAPGAEFWNPAGPEIAVNAIIAAGILDDLNEAFEKGNAGAVAGLVGEILEGKHRLQG